MKDPTKQAQPSAFRQDLLRGLRWGTILLIVMLLSIAAYRVISSSPAVASQAPAAPEELAPVETPAVAVQPANPIQVGAPTIKNADAPPPPPLVRRKSVAKASGPVIPQPRQFSAPTRTIVVVPAAAPKEVQNSFVADPLPKVTEEPVVPASQLSAPASVPSLAPPPEENAGQGNRATRIVRSVGRIFRRGRKDADSGDAESTKK